MNSAEDRKNERKSMYITLGVHSALLILFFFLLAWKEPFPPIREYGIELNFGLDEQGTGTIQRQAPVTTTPTEQPSDATENYEQRDIQENVREEIEQSLADEIIEEETSESTTDVAAEDINSPDVVKEQTEETIETPNESKTVVEEVSKSITEETNPETTVDTGGNNQGNDENEVGDKGNPKGKVDERAIYGNPGAGGAASLDMAGWIWDYIPRPNDQSEENGRIVFSITIDDVGEILSIRTLEKTVTPEVERIYRVEVEKLTFSTTGDNVRPASSSTGTITFIIKAN